MLLAMSYKRQHHRYKWTYTLYVNTMPRATPIVGELNALGINNVVMVSESLVVHAFSSTSLIASSSCNTGAPKSHMYRYQRSCEHGHKTVELHNGKLKSGVL